MTHISAPCMNYDVAVVLEKKIVVLEERRPRLRMAGSLAVAEDAGHDAHASLRSHDAIQEAQCTISRRLPSR